MRGAMKGNTTMMIKWFSLLLLPIALMAGSAAGETGSFPKNKPNILWLVAEDASPHIGCYGETAIKTPHLDALAAEGVRFDNAYVTAPVCSPARSALATGMYQTTIGAHNHRSCNSTRTKSAGNEAYYASYQLPKETPLLSRIFQKAGYYTVNGSGPSKGNKKGKEDYNFDVVGDAYEGFDWRKAGDKPFFAQIQLKGGKSRDKSFKPEGDYKLPPYYPEDPLLRADWESYLGSWVKVDNEVGEIVASLKKAGVYDNTLIAFITDHGISHARGKQFVYEEGARIPMIIRFPDKRLAGTVRKDLAIHIDLAPVSMAFAGIPIPEPLQGRDLFEADYKKRDRVFVARDRCDETIEILRSVRTPQYKYIRNFVSYRSHMQDNQYKGGKKIIKKLHELHAAGKLNELQSRFFTPTRPPEELYDVVADPYETKNLAGKAEHKATLEQMRHSLTRWMVESGDPGLIPEPILEDLGRKHGSKPAAMKQPAIKKLVPRLVELIEAGERKDLSTVRSSLKAADPCERYWAATWSGVNLDRDAIKQLKQLASDSTPAVRVAACLALCRLGLSKDYLPKLVELIEDPNLIVGLYAMNAIEQTEILNDLAGNAAKIGLKSRYEFTRRYALRLAGRVAAEK